MDSRPALLVIDAQDSFNLNPRRDRSSNPDFETNVATLIDRWRAASLPIFFILHTDSDPGFREGDPELRLMPFIDRRADEPLLLKNTRNAFTSTDLQQRLDALGIRKVVVTGIQTEQCCETTARVAADLGFEVDFVTDATRTFPIVNDETGEELGVRDIIHRTEFVLRRRFARIVTTKALAAEIEQTWALSTTSSS